jgi:hypothetical protein
MKRQKPIKVRREWRINPRERVREDKRIEDEVNPCQRCTMIDTDTCLECEYR